MLGLVLLVDHPRQSRCSFLKGKSRQNNSAMKQNGPSYGNATFMLLWELWSYWAICQMWSDKYYCRRFQWFPKSDWTRSEELELELGDLSVTRSDWFCTIVRKSLSDRRYHLGEDALVCSTLTKPQPSSAFFHFIFHVSIQTISVSHAFQPT